ncbi:hypothetical protein ACIPIX_07900 [Pseudomonas protegens]|uniref:hypothetical protein n=1 Tax=Pseudomonas protegens TaxID=380021 RepID=UPI00382467EC
MQLHEVDVIKELFSVRDVNQAFSEGWRIVAPAVQCYRDDAQARRLTALGTGDQG